jgi:acetylornithine deacetylase/succinyl-diaminopimelate desuccinylase-like protein
MRSADIQPRVAGLMPELVEELRALVAYPSVSFDGSPAEPVLGTGRAVLDLMQRSGFSDAALLEVGKPSVYADVAGPEGSPTVLLYAHYDVQPAPAEAGWLTDPWTLTEQDGRLFGRGAADDKSGIIIHAATMRLLKGRPPVRLKLVIERDEEANSSLETFVDAHPDMFRADLYISADGGNLVAGQPVLVTTLRGDVTCLVTTRTLAHPAHSGLFGGAAPDALVALVHVLAGLWNDDGGTTVPGLRTHEWPGTEFPADLIRATAEVLPDIDLVGSGSVASRVWTGPSATVLGIDAPSVAESANVLIPAARAKIGLRIAPGADAGGEQKRLTKFLSARAPRWARVEVTPVSASGGFEALRDGQALRATWTAVRDVYGVEPVEIGSGGGIPLMRTLQRWAPEAEFVLWGAQDLRANAHGPNESVDPAEIKRVIACQVLLLERLWSASDR